MFNQTAQLNHQVNLFELTVRQASPLLLGVKPASLFCLPQSPLQYQTWKGELRSQSIEVFPLYHCKKRVAVLVYSPQLLGERLAQKSCKDVLAQFGYPTEIPLTELLRKLKKRLLQYSKGVLPYPHEVGIFLGYPAEDVLDFYRGEKPCLFCKYWKVFNNP